MVIKHDCKNRKENLDEYDVEVVQIVIHDDYSAIEIDCNDGEYLLEYKINYCPFCGKDLNKIIQVP
jgi:co-chaperonin GroES (HSP10)